MTIITPPIQLPCRWIILIILGREAGQESWLSEHLTEAGIGKSTRLGKECKEFQDPNCARAGDLCCDTEADCIANPKLFPAVIPNANGQVQLDCATQNCSNGCGSCGNPGLYKDYNLDSIAGNPSNPMSNICGLITSGTSGE